MVSVVIPVYNGAKYIEKTIRTILNSTYQNLEIIAVVDGSRIIGPGSLPETESGRRQGKDLL